MFANIKPERPIFIIGSARSGTTILYRILSGHTDLAWFSNYTARWPRLPQLAALSGLYSVGTLRRMDIRGLPVPSEGHKIWDLCKPVRNSPSDPPLTEDDVAPDDLDKARNVIARHMKWQGRPRFVNKNTRNSRRIRYLNKIFGDALFIHVMRDPRATTASIMRVPWWPDLKVWFNGTITPREWAEQGNEPVALAASMWSAEVERILADKDEVPEERYMEVTYEEFVINPKVILNELTAFCGLKWDSAFEVFVDSFELRDMNYKFRDQFSRGQLKTLQGIVEPLAARVGYDITQ